MRIKSDNTRRYAGQYCFDEVAPFIELPVGFNQAIALGAQLFGHTIERPVQGSYFIARAAFIEARCEVPATHVLCRNDQIAYRSHQAGREYQANPDGGHKQQKRNQDKHHRKGNFDLGPLALQFLVLFDGAVNSFHMQKNARFNEPADIQKNIDEPVEFDQRLDPVVCLGLEHDRLTFTGLFKRPRRNGFVEQRESKIVPPQQCPTA